jgi:hypothetical protein
MRGKSRVGNHLFLWGIYCSFRAKKHLSGDNFFLIFKFRRFIVDTKEKCLELLYEYFWVAWFRELELATENYYKTHTHTHTHTHTENSFIYI